MSTAKKAHSIKSLWILFLFSMVAVSIYLVGCGGSTPETTTPPAQTPPPATPPPTTPPPPPPPSITGVLQYKFDLAGTGAYLAETVLTAANVNVSTFGKVATSPQLDGVIFTQPLYIRNLAIAGGTHNVIFLATENDSVYALDAQDLTQVLWQRSFIDSANGILPANGITGGRTGIGPVVGVTGTPVIDPTTQTMYVSAMTDENGITFHRLHALDITTGAEKFGGPTEIAATVPGTGIDTDGKGNVAFNPPTQNQRAGLQLVNGVVYVSFASFSDTEPYHGWIFAFDAATMAQLAVLNLSPNSEGAGLWQGGSAPVADADGNIYIQTGDGHNLNIIGGPDWGDTILKLKVVNGAFTVVDWFMPYNQDCIDQNDLDLGSSGPMLLPDQTGTHPHLLVTGSKEGRIYLIDRDAMGNFNLGSNSQIPQEILINPGPCENTDVNNTLRVYGTSTYWNGFVYMGSVMSNLRAFQLANGHMTQTSASTTVYQGNGQVGRGPVPVVSANGTTGAVVWTVEYTPTNTVILHAYDATNLANELYNSQQNASRDALGRGAVFTTPVVIDGKVYVTSVNRLNVYGLTN